MARATTSALPARKAQATCRPATDLAAPSIHPRGSCDADPYRGGRSMKRAFVTGGSGFVGRNLISTLAGRGVEVRALARSASADEAVRLAGAHSTARGDLDATGVMTDTMRDCD